MKLIDRARTIRGNTVLDSVTAPPFYNYVYPIPLTNLPPFYKYTLFNKPITYPLILKSVYIWKCRKLFLTQITPHRLVHISYYTHVSTRKRNGTIRVDYGMGTKQTRNGHGTVRSIQRPFNTRLPPIFFKWAPVVRCRKVECSFPKMSPQRFYPRVKCLPGHSTLVSPQTFYPKVQCSAGY